MLPGKYSLLLLFCCLSSVLLAQPLTVSPAVTDATCSSNGELDVRVTGGSGDYRYFLSNDCGETFPPQTTPTYTTLAPCTYRIEVVDRVTDAQMTEDFTIDAAGSVLETFTTFEGCDALVYVTGGAPPYAVTYTVGGQAEVSQTSEGENINAGVIGDATLSGRVVDNCGNSRTFSADGTDTRVTYFNTNQRSADVQFTAGDGVAPFVYTVESTAGTFTNSTGVFTYDQIGCDLFVSVAGACGNEPARSSARINGTARIKCVNYAEGTVELSVFPPGVQPYVFTVLAGGVETNFSDTIITGLPAGLAELEVQGFNACGQTLGRAETTTVPRIVTPVDAFSCANDSLIVSTGVACSGMSYLPIQITCESCPGVTTYTQTFAGQEIMIDEGVSPGNYSLAFENSCGDRFVCRDEVRLDARPACDSIVATFIQEFQCDNGTQSQRLLQDPSQRFSLFTATGALLVADSPTGVFDGLSFGDYRVDLTSDCGSYSTDVSLTDGGPINPSIFIFPVVDVGDADTCQTLYNFEVSSDEGPYVLEFLSIDRPPLEINDLDESSCDAIAISQLIPAGDYRLVSQRLCGERNFTLPELRERRIDSVSVAAICPSSSEVIIHGTRRGPSEWTAYFNDLGFQLIGPIQFTDRFVVDGIQYPSDTISNLPPGRYAVTVDINFAQISCPLDTVSFVVPDYRPVELDVTGNFICDSDGFAPLELSPRLGNPPYVLRLIDCNDPTQILQTFDVGAGQTVNLTDVTLGVYCYVVEDACEITTDFQVEVRRLDGQLDFQYACSPAVRISTDTIDARFAWTDAGGTPLGSAAEIIVPESLQDRIYNLAVEFSTCTAQTSITVPGRPILPELALSGGDNEVARCAGDTVTLSVAGDALSTYLFFGVDSEVGQAIDGADAGAEIRVTEQGLYTVVATNDLGCERRDSVRITRFDTPDPIIGAAPGQCPDTFATIGVLSGPDEVVTWSTVPSLMTDSIAVSTPGTYAVTVTSSDGCVGVDSFVYTAPASLVLDIETDSVICFGEANGRVTLAGQGGTGTRTFLINGSEVAADGMVPNLDVGTYTATLRDANGCTTTMAFTIGQPDSLRVDLGPDQSIEFGDQVTIEPESNANVIVEYLTEPTLPDSLLRSNQIALSPTEDLNLSLTIVDERGCVATDEVLITVERNLGFYAPTAFSPNDDDTNDRWTLFGPPPELAIISDLKIFDRWGGMVFEAADLIANDTENGWAGHTEGGVANPSGVYVWTASVTYFDGSTTVLFGEVNLIR